METLQKLTSDSYRALIFSLEGFLARAFPLRVNAEVSVIQEAHSSLTSLELSGKKNHAFCSLKTLKGYYLTKEGRPLPLSSVRLMSWGMTSNGNCLTAKITESHRTGKECSLSDILEEHPDQKYFLSEQAVKNIMEKQTSKGARLHLQDEAQEGKTVGVTMSSEHYEPTKTDKD